MLFVWLGRDSDSVTCGRDGPLQVPNLELTLQVRSSPIAGLNLTMRSAVSAFMHDKPHVGMRRRPDG